MKKILAVILCLFVFCSCSEVAENEGNKNIKIVATVFPAYDWISEITKNTETEVLLIPSNGVDIHSYQPSAADIVEISTSDLFVCSSGEENAWYDDIKRNKTLDVSRKNSEGHIDVHSWLSVKNAIEICEEICENLVAISPQNAETFEKNTDEYIKELEKLHSEYMSFSETVKGKTIVVADRFPFRHMTDEYNIGYVAAFEGCSSESEISFDTVRKLSSKVTELKTEYVFVSEKSDRKIADAVIRNLNNENIKVKELNSMQSVNKKEIENKLSYISVMRKNLEELKEVLN